MAFRFEDLDRKKSEYKDFTVRRRAPTLVEQFYLCLVLILAGIIGVLLINDRLGLSAILFTIIGAAAVYITSQTNRNRDLLQSVELQNALFASVISRGWAFSLIAGRKDGDILYYSPGFKELFPDAPARVGEWLMEAHAAPEAASRVAESIRAGTEQDIPLALEAPGQSRLSFVMSVEDIQRPAGFMLLRCRESAGN